MNAARLPSNLIPCRPAHVLVLAQRMRADEQRQFCVVAGLDTFDADVAAHVWMQTLQASQGYALTALMQDDMPAAAGGFQPVGPGIWQAWMLGSEDGWQQCWRSLTKGARWLMQALWERGDIHRLQTSALTSRAHATVWFERSLGFRYEGTQRHFGRHGEDMALYSKVRGD